MYDCTFALISALLVYVILHFWNVVVCVEIFKEYFVVKFD